MYKMRKLKFIILSLTVLTVEGVWAVQLPSTSYDPYSSGNGGYEASYSDAVSGVSLPSKPFLQLGSYDFDCSTQSSSFKECTDCCRDAVMDCYKECGTDQDCKSKCDSENLACANECGRSLPLSAPLWFALLLPLLAGALKPLLSHKKDL